MYSSFWTQSITRLFRKLILRPFEDGISSYSVNRSRKYYSSSQGERNLIANKSTPGFAPHSEETKQIAPELVNEGGLLSVRFE